MSRDLKPIWLPANTDSAYAVLLFEIYPIKLLTFITVNFKKVTIINPKLNMILNWNRKNLSWGNVIYEKKKQTN